MGIFDKLGGGKDVKLTPKSALALGAMTVIGIDGSIEDDEISMLRRIVRGDGNAFDQAFRTYKERAIPECVDLVCKSMTDQKQKLVFITNLLDIAMADGVLAGAEKDLMAKYIEKLEVPEKAVEEIVEFIANKNDFSIFESR